MQRKNENKTFIVYFSLVDEHVIACLLSFGVSKNEKSMKMLVVLADTIPLGADDSCRQQMPSVGILRIGTNKNGGVNL
jgi:hypothetical protein